MERCTPSATSRTLSMTTKAITPLLRENALRWSEQSTSLRPYAERTKFTTGTDHSAPPWLTILIEFFGPLTRWCLRLAELNFTIEYRLESSHVVPDDLFRLVAKYALTQTINDGIPFFEHQFFFLNSFRTPSPPVLASPPPLPNGPPPDVVVLATTRSRRASHTGAHLTQFSSEPSPSFIDVTKYHDEYCYDTDDLDPLDIERATGDTSHVHRELDRPSSSLGFDDVITA